MSSTTNLPADTAVVVTIDRVDANGAATSSLEETVIGVVSASNLINCIRGVEGTAQAHSAGAVAEVLITARGWNDIVDGIVAEHTQLGVHNIPSTSLISQYAADSGTANTYAVTLSPVVASYVTGMIVRFKAGNANSGASTLNVNALGAKAIKKLDGATALVSGDIAAGQIVTVEYDGTNFQMISPLGQVPAAATPIQLNDTNGNAAIKTSATTSAVNQFTAKNAAANNAVDMQATGTDSNIGIKITPKGTGIFQPTTSCLARAYLAGAQSPNSSSDTKVLIDTSDYDPGSNLDVTTNHRFTAPVTGYYNITGQVSFGGNGTGFRVVRIVKNGATELLYMSGQQAIGTSYGQARVTGRIKLTAADYIELWCWQNSGGGLAMQLGSAYTFLEVMLVSL